MWRFYASRAIEKLQGKKKIFPPATAFAFTGDTGEHMGGFLGFNFQEPLSQQGQQPKECKSEALTTGEEV